MEFLDKLITPLLPVKRKYAVSAVDVNTGTYVVFNESSNTQYVKQVVSSSSIPFVFPHQNWPDLGYTLMDGGTVWNTNLVKAVQRCREQVDDDSKITVDIVTCSSHTLDDWKEKDDTINNFLRNKQVKDYYSGI